MKISHTIGRRVLVALTTGALAAGVCTVPALSTPVVIDNLYDDGGVNVTTLPGVLNEDGTGTASFLVNFSGIFSSNHGETVRGVVVSIPDFVKSEDITWTLTGTPNYEKAMGEETEKNLSTRGTEKVNVPLTYATKTTTVNEYGYEDVETNLVTLPSLREVEAGIDAPVPAVQDGVGIIEGSNGYGLSLKGAGVGVVRIDIKMTPDANGEFQQLPIRAEWAWKCNSEGGGVGSFEQGCQSILDARYFQQTGDAAEVFDKIGYYSAEDADEHGIKNVSQCAVTDNLNTWSRIGQDKEKSGFNYKDEYRLYDSKDISYYGLPLNEDGCDTGLVLSYSAPQKDTPANGSGIDNGSSNPIEVTTTATATETAVQTEVRVEERERVINKGSSVGAQCAPAIMAATLPLAVLVPMSLASRVQIPGLESLSAQVDNALRSFNESVTSGMRNESIERAAAAYNESINRSFQSMGFKTVDTSGINASLQQAAPHVARTIVDMAAVAAGIAAIGIIASQCVPTATAATTTATTSTSAEPTEAA